MSSWRVFVKTPGDRDWVGNGVRHATQADAEEAAKDLAARWTAVEEWKVEPSTDEPNR